MTRDLIFPNTKGAPSAVSRTEIEAVWDGASEPLGSLDPNGSRWGHGASTPSRARREHPAPSSTDSPAPSPSTRSKTPRPARKTSSAGSVPIASSTLFCASLDRRPACPLTARRGCRRPASTRSTSSASWIVSSANVSSAPAMTAGGWAVSWCSGTTRSCNLCSPREASDAGHARLHRLRPDHPSQRTTQPLPRTRKPRQPRASRKAERAGTKRSHCSPKTAQPSPLAHVVSPFGRTKRLVVVHPRRVAACPI